MNFFILVCGLLFSHFFTSSCFAESADQHLPVVKIGMHFSNDDPRQSAGFLMTKGSNLYLVLATHALGLTDKREPMKMTLYDIRTEEIIGSAALQHRETWYRQHPETENNRAPDYVDVSAISLDLAGLQVDSSVRQAAISYDKLSARSALTDYKGPVRLRSWDGEKTCSEVKIVDEIQRGDAGRKTYHGIKYDNCSPDIIRGDSGGLVEWRIGDDWFVAGIHVQGPEQKGPFGWASSSDMIRETVDMFDAREPGK